MIFVLNKDVNLIRIIDGWKDCVEDVISFAIIVKLEEF